MNSKTRDIALALFCAFLGSVKGLLVSQVKSLGPIQIFGIRSVGATCFIFPIIVGWNYKLWYDYKCNLILLLRSVIGNVAVCGYYFGFVYLPIAEASLLFYSTPVFTVIIGCVFLNEKCGASEIISIVLSLSGVALVCIPDFGFNSNSYSESSIKGVAGSLVGAIAQAVALAVIRKITYVPPAVVSFWWACVGIVFSVVLSSAQTGGLVPWQCGWEATMLIFITIVGFVSELCLVAALKSTDAVIVSIALTTEILWAFLLQIFVTHDIPNWMVFCGGAAIMISVVLRPGMSRVAKCWSNKRLRDIEKAKIGANTQIINNGNGT